MDIGVNVSNLNNIDRQTAIFMIAQHNEPIIVENARRAALIPPGVPLPLLSSGTPAEIKTSYEIVLAASTQSTHTANITLAAENTTTARQIREALRNSPTPAQLSAALTALTS